MKTMTPRERIDNQIAGRPVDRIPMIGGWNLGVANVARLAGLTIEDYLNDPVAGVVQANRRLGVDAIVPPIVPREVDAIRAGQLIEHDFAAVEPEALLARAERIPDTESKVLAALDLAAVEAEHRRVFTDWKAAYGGLTVIPTLWAVPADFSLYFQYGYTAFLSAIALYPEAVARIWWECGVQRRAANAVIARLLKEFDFPSLVFCGHDICNNTGPMCSPAYLHEQYWSHARYSIEPLVEAGFRLVHHCDGNVMPLVDDMIAAGFSGFQGFQYECGVDPYELKKRRSRKGETMLFMGGMSVTRSLPMGTPRDVEEEVEYLLDVTDGGVGLFLFTSNVTGVEVPAENIEAGYRHLARQAPGTRFVRDAWRPWPWRVRHGG